MSENLRRSLRRPFQQLALSLSLLSSASLAAAQTTPPPPPRQVIPAPAPAPQLAPQVAPAPAPGGYQAAPGDYQAAPPGQVQQAYPAQPPPPQPYYQGQPQAQPQGYPPPPGAYPGQPYPGYQQPYTSPPGQAWIPPARPRRGMMVAGASILGGSYLLAMVIGTALIDSNNDPDDLDCRDCKAAGRLLFIPVVGPFIAIGEAHNGDVGLMLLGMAELVGAGLLTGGIIRYRNSKRALDARGFSWELGQDKRLSLNMQTGASGAGPRMRIEF